MNRGDVLSPELPGGLFCLGLFFQVEALLFTSVCSSAGAESTHSAEL